MADPLRLDGEVALVTGASRGLGAAIARELSGAGAAVVVHGRDEAALAEVAASLPGPSAVVAMALDEPGAAPALVARAREAIGPVSILVANAADQRLGGIGDLDADDWRALLELDLVVPAALLREVAGQAPDPGRAAAVAIASVEALFPFPGHAGYAAAKAGLVSLVASAATELAPMRVNAVAPGLIDRPDLAQAWPDGLRRWQATAPLARPVAAGEVAAAVRFLLAPAASGITGATLPVDAGWSTSARW